MQESVTVPKQRIQHAAMSGLIGGAAIGIVFALDPREAKGECNGSSLSMSIRL